MVQITSLVYKLMQLFANLMAVGSPLAVKMAQRLADTALDVLEEYALTTETTLDDRFLAWARARLKIPEFEEMPKQLPADPSAIDLPDESLNPQGQI